jgi:hypothetical protein
MRTSDGPSRWKTFGGRVIYDNLWAWLGQVDVELSDGKRLRHHVVRLHRAAMMVLVDEQDRVLLLWCHKWQQPASIRVGSAAARPGCRRPAAIPARRGGPGRDCSPLHPRPGPAGAGGGGQCAGSEGRHEIGASRGFGSVCLRTVDDGAGAGVVAGAVGGQSAHRPVVIGCEGVMQVTMHFHN